MLKEMVRTTVTLTSGGRTHSAYDSNAHQRRQDASPRVEKDLVELILMRHQAPDGELECLGGNAGRSSTCQDVRDVGKEGAGRDMPCKEPPGGLGARGDGIACMPGAYELILPR
jgi:hypothetical protein